MTKQPPRWINLPDTSTPNFVCESLNRVIDEDCLPELTSADRRLAYLEISRALQAIQGEIQLAAYRGSLPSVDFRFCSVDEKWMQRAKKLRNVLGELLFIIRQYERDLEPRAVEEEAKRERLAQARRFRRQQAYIDVFCHLVEEELGREKLGQLLQQAGEEADEYLDLGIARDSRSVLRRELISRGMPDGCERRLAEVA